MLLNQGYAVTGSDIAESANTNRLTMLGATVFIGHEESNIEAADVVVYSSAVTEKNPEMRAAVEAPSVLNSPLVAFCGCIQVAHCRLQLCKAISAFR